ncbi:hypothetical protein TNCV_3844181 [Trichonephila clavipes]|nr:hypothetical protein TNCV_3844181 [Trichonephila clavipes]
MFHLRIVASHILALLSISIHLFFTTPFTSDGEMNDLVAVVNARTVPRMWVEMACSHGSLVVMVTNSCETSGFSPEDPPCKKADAHYICHSSKSSHWLGVEV